MLRVATLLVAVAVIALKVALLGAATEGGFVACYRSLVPPGDTQGCQRSFDDVLGLSGATKVDKSISFSGQTWDLSFFNDLVYNIQPLDGNLDRNDLPFEATWTGDADVPTPTTFRVRYTGQLTIDDGTQSIELPPQYQSPTTANVTLAAGSHHMKISYRFDDGHRIGGAPATAPVLDIPLEASNPLPWSVFAILIDVGVAILVVAATILTVRLIASYERWMLAAVLVAGCLGEGASLLLLHRSTVAYALPGIAVVITVVVLVWKRIGAHTLWLVSAFGGGCFAIVLYGLTPGYGVLSFNNDPLYYASFARSILVTGSLRAGESVFYFQPFYRYVLFVQSAVLGDGWALVFALAIAAIWFLGLYLAASLRPSLAALSFLGLAGLFLLTIIAQAVPYNVYARLSEYVAWIDLLLAAVLVLPPGPPRRLPWASVLLGMAVIIRPEMLPGAVAMFAIGAWRTGAGRFMLAGSIGLFLAVTCLPLLHNLYYGHTFAVFTSSKDLRDSFEFGFRDVLARPGSTVGRHVIMLLDLLTTGNRVLDLAIHAGQVLWLSAVVVAAMRRRLDALAVLAVPAAFALPFIVVQVEVYYPRHIIATYLMIWPALMIAASMLFRPQQMPQLSLDRLRIRLSRARHAPSPEADFPSAP